MAPAGLEICYRRLLRWYPAEHRALHQEEMLGVLMAGAESGRNRPGLAESADLASPGPRRGRQLMRHRDWALLAAGSAAAGVLTRDFGFVLFKLGGESLHRNASLLAGLVVVLLLLVMWLSSARGKRLALSFGVLAYGLLLMDGFIDQGGPWGADTISGSVGQVLVIFLLAAVTYRTWRRSRSAPSESRESLT